LRSLFFLLIGIFLSVEAAALEKCVGAGGKTTYSDSACPSGAKRSALGGDAALADAQIEYYQVQGSDYGSLLASMNANGPNGFHGFTTWYLNYEYRTRSGAAGCAVDSVTTRLDLKVKLPRWAPPGNAASGLGERYDRYLTALRIHEDGHLQTGRDFESNFKRSALALSAPDCGALDSALRAQFDQLLKQANARDKNYDTNTGHGATQGAVFR